MVLRDTGFESMRQGKKKETSFKKRGTSKGAKHKSKSPLGQIKIIRAGLIGIQVKESQLLSKTYATNKT